MSYPAGLPHSTKVVLPVYNLLKHWVAQYTAQLGGLWCLATQGFTPEGSSGPSDHPAGARAFAAVGGICDSSLFIFVIFT